MEDKLRDIATCIETTQNLIHQKKNKVHDITAKLHQHTGDNKGQYNKQDEVEHEVEDAIEAQQKAYDELQAAMEAQILQEREAFKLHYHTYMQNKPPEVDDEVHQNNFQPPPEATAAAKERTAKAKVKLEKATAAAASSRRVAGKFNKTNTARASAPSKSAAVELQAAQAQVSAVKEAS